MRYFFLLYLFSSVALSAVTPKPGADPHVRHVNYNRTQPVNLLCALGVMTHIEFSEGESVKAIMAGDTESWFFADKDNHLFFKPLQMKDIDTNLTVVTTLRSYEFNLSLLEVTSADPNAWTNPNVIHSLIFKYPEIEAAKAEETAKEEQKEVVKEEIKERFEQAKTHIHNTNYWANGDKEIIPTSAWDDGNFVTLEFAKNGDFPEVYEVLKDSKKAIVKTHSEGNKIVIEKMAGRYVLRLGDLVAGVVNAGFAPGVQRDNESGTIASDVTLKVKEPSGE